MNGILQTNSKSKGLVLDPRTKLLMLITMSTIVLGGITSERLGFLSPCFCALPLILFLSARKIKSALVYTLVYGAAYTLFILASPHLSGVLYYLLLGTAGIITKFIPSIMLGVYVVSSTTVSEFTAAMQRMHVSEKLIIPLSVMFRFFPTVGDEFSSINNAMRMRGISLGGENVAKMLEYRFIPLMTCSVKIGEELSAAALTRGLGGECKRTNVCKIGLHLQDYFFMLICVAAFVLLISDKLGILGGIS